VLAKLNIPELSSLSQPLSMHVHEKGDLMVSKKIRDEGIWEPFETTLIVKALKSANNFIDVGANIGYYSLIAASVFSEQAKGSVFAFEPEQANFQLLQQSISHNGFTNITAVNAGLSDSDKQASIYLSPDNFGDHQVYDRGQNRQQSSIQLLNGGDFLADKISSIDVLKIDTQGAEFSVIKGLLPLLQQSLKLKMVVEFWPFGLRKAGFHAHDLLDMLLSLTLPMYIIDHIEHRLIPCVEADLRPWIDSLDVESDNEGFLNLYFGEHDEAID
jgi:FkbM family methyltransferase